MSVYAVKLPDVGEGVAEAELVTWFVEVGDVVNPESPLAEVLTDKATVEISSPVTGVVVALHGEPGDVLAVGSEFVGIETDPDQTAGDIADEGTYDGAPRADPAGGNAGEGAAHGVDAGAVLTASNEPHAPSAKPATEPVHEPSIGTNSAPAKLSSGSLAAPAVRARARHLGFELATVSGTGPDGRVLHADLDRLLVREARRVTTPPTGAGDLIREEPVRGIRRRIAERVSAAWIEIPHITYVEAIDATELEALRAQLNRSTDAPRLTILPFLVRAIAIACGEQPRLNAHYDHASETLFIHEEVHVGIATQTDDGLMVPVVRRAGGRSLSDLATEIGWVTAEARGGRATREQLSGSTITITSLGVLGGIATTPILNRPEVTIIGVNKLETRPLWNDGSFHPRRMFNLSSSFDHRIVDGWDAATFVQRIRTLLESPALLFVGND